LGRTVDRAGDLVASAVGVDGRVGNDVDAIGVDGETGAEPRIDLGAFAPAGNDDDRPALSRPSLRFQERELVIGADRILNYLYYIS
jgi:hypothetical protein